MTAAHDWSKTVERGHCQRKRRTYTLMGNTNGIRDVSDPNRRWAEPGSAVRYCITNPPKTTGAAQVAQLVSSHWSLEKHLH